MNKQKIFLFIFFTFLFPFLTFGQTHSDTIQLFKDARDNGLRGENIHAVYKAFGKTFVFFKDGEENQWMRAISFPIQPTETNSEGALSYHVRYDPSEGFWVGDYHFTQNKVDGRMIGLTAKIGTKTQIAESVQLSLALLSHFRNDSLRLSSGLQTLTTFKLIFDGEVAYQLRGYDQTSQTRGNYTLVYALRAHWDGHDFKHYQLDVIDVGLGIVRENIWGQNINGRIGFHLNKEATVYFETSSQPVIGAVKFPQFTDNGLYLEFSLKGNAPIELGPNGQFKVGYIDTFFSGDLSFRRNFVPFDLGLDPDTLVLASNEHSDLVRSEQPGCIP